MTIDRRAFVLFGFMFLLFIMEGMTVSWNSALGIANMGLISAILALGVNIQWGYAGLFNVGVVGFVALGGLAPVLVSLPPVLGAWDLGGPRILAGLATGVAAVALAVYLNKRLVGTTRLLAMLVVLVGGFFLYRFIFDAGVAAVESNNPATYGNLGGLGLPALFSWPVGALFAAGAAWVIGKTALGLRSDYLAIATLGIGEIIVAVLKNEDWLARGVKNVFNVPRPFPVPREIELQANPEFLSLVNSIGADPISASSITVKLAYTLLFLAVLLALIWLTEKALKSPWGRMMRAIRDNETSSEAMGKDVTRRHLQIFILGSAVCGLAGAMMVTLFGQLTPGSYIPLQFTFLIWVMVIVGGSGNNWGAVLGGMVIFFFWIKVEAWGPDLMRFLTQALPEGDLKKHLIESAAQMRLFTMGLILLLVLRFAPRGLLPEK